ncbi:pseudouridylate synthase 7 homolog [Asterias amurensis]|uniref:pseudouridylate synthase 7 homolog n=1 Tax=Asterias amurensis TaxID=7602 RepID=UPI003AB59DE6
MAERQSSKRDHPERTSEAEAKPSCGPAASSSKRVRVLSEGRERGMNVVDSTTSQEASHRNEAPAPNLPVSYGEVEVDETNPSSTSGRSHLSSNENEPSSCVNSEATSSSIPSLSEVSNNEHTVSLSRNACDSQIESTSEGNAVDNSPTNPVALQETQPTVEEDLTGLSTSYSDQGQGSTVASDVQCVETVKEEETGLNKRALTLSTPLTGLKESDVGIVEYISKHDGFHGVIKQRFQDFLVNEVDLDKKIVRLTDMKSPDPKTKVPVNIDDVLNPNDQQRLNELNASSDKAACHCIEVQDLEKDQRKKIHEVIRQDFATLESSTLDGEGKKVIKVTKVSRGGRKTRSNWGKDRPNYCRFVMQKENIEVNDALTLISKYLHVRRQSFGFSGTKDKRGVTVQEVTVYRVEAERLCRLNAILRGIRLGNFRYVKDHLSLGDHSGNHFVIVLRDVDGTQEQIDRAMISMRDVGFINYFGMQRFGNSQVATHLVGRAVLHSNWEEAVDLILKPREGYRQDNRWRQKWMDTKNAKSVMDILPKHKTISIEMQLLKGLYETRNNFFQALQCIPRNVRLLYVHSYQSYIWNTLITKRIQKYGLNVIPGDLIVTEEVKGEESETKVLFLDASNVDSYTIQDIVLPLPGYTMEYPKNEIGDWYGDLLHKDGLDFTNMRHPVRDYSLTGTYRKIVVKPDNVSWSIIPYNDVVYPLVLSDLDRLEGKQPPQVETDGQLRALRLEFTLSSCCYATMAIREVLKIDTSAAHQSTLNTTMDGATLADAESLPNDEEDCN